MDSNASMTTLVIFGATGDLTHRKLIPALFSLYRRGKLPDPFTIIAYARRPFSDDDFRALLRTSSEELGASFDAPQWEKFAACIVYQRGDLSTIEDYKALHERMHALEGRQANRLYYLATAPNFYEPIIQNLAALGLSHEDEGWRRIVVEKPFGSDLGSAMALNKTLHNAFEERQVYRIDHYLGKETVQNVLFMRFANAIFEPIWNRNYVDHVQITVAETVDVGSRAGYYEESGVLRDMFQNHLLQLLTLVAIEAPNTFTADALRNEKVKVLSAIRTPAAGDTIRAQYSDYRQTPNVAPGSTTPTYAALKLYIDNWRWQDVPFYLRSGKALARKTSEIAVQFRRPPHLFFNLPGSERLTPNVLSLCIQPDEGIHLSFQAKVPNSPSAVQSVDMEFHYRDSFDEHLPEAYERLLLDAMLGDQTLFTREDEITYQWKLIDAVHAAWQSPQAPPLVTYARDSWGPEEADYLLADDGRIWRTGCGGHDEA